MKGWAFVFGVLTGASLLVAACGSSSNEVTFGTGLDAGGDVTLPDAGRLRIGDGAMNGVCHPLTCTKLGYNCGKTGDGCGGTLDCGGCTGDNTCGGSGKFSVCGGGTCPAKSCADQGITCGPASDGCGHLLQCGSCNAPDSCGGGGVSNTCGHGFLPPDGGLDGGACVPKTCASQGITCGPAGDGCGNLIASCGGTCPTGEGCGVGGTPGVCGKGVQCVAKTCGDLGITCGPAGDGCGGVLQCGGCTAPDTCGGGSQAGACGHGFLPPDGGLNGGPCVPKSCGAQGLACGPAGDGCGNLIASCGTCSGGETCGGGGVDGKCGTPATCVPLTCAQQGISCGPAADGCGNLIASCWPAGMTACPGNEICGGGTMPGVCGNTPLCTNLCNDQVACPGGGTTTFTGHVVAGTLPAYLPASAPNSPDPIPNVLVYVPNSVPSAFGTKVQCASCSADVTGSPLIQATTDATGLFTLTNVPVPPGGGPVPIVIQLGRWRRIFGAPPGGTANPNNTPMGFTPSQCESVDLGQLRMPRNKSEGDIPFTAISTGQIDPMECVLLKMGVDSAEFTNPGSGGRVEMYVGNGSAVNGSTPRETTLVPNATNSTATLEKYDQVIFPCWGSDPLATTTNQKTTKQQQNVVSYTSAGGRVFATHLSYSWLEFAGATPFNTTATWTGDPLTDPTNDLEYDTGTAVIPSTGPADVTTMYAWMNGLGWNGASSGSFDIVQERNNFTATATGTELWMTVNSAAPTIADGTGTYPTTFPAVYSFNTPFSATPSASQCGKVVYSDFHVSLIQGGGDDDEALTFPNECTPDPMNAQEKALEYLIWDLASCVAPVGPTCTPKTCQELGVSCGPVGDGCGGEITSCGSCNGCEKCGGGGTPGVCGGTCCTPTTCNAQGIECGPADNGCGVELQCGPCPAGQTCGGGGVNGKCGSIDAGVCVPKTCTQLGFNCGPAGDGCGGEITSCGTCTGCDTCGGGGKPSNCGGACCMTQTCAAQGIECGPAGDGCGGEIASCGTCPPGQTCGGGGVNGKCGSIDAAVCVPRTCSAQGLNCGPAGDGCGNVIQCGPCTAPDTCGGSGKPGVCGPSCIPKTCKELGFNCGASGDGCGGELQCGTCMAPQTCGGGGVSSVCGGTAAK